MKKKGYSKIRNAIIVGIGSDIGREIANRLEIDGWNVIGTYRNKKNLEGLNKEIKVLRCDLTKPSEIKSAVIKINQKIKKWDLVVVGAGTEEPIGSFWSCDDNKWDLNIGINALYPLRFIRKLYKTRNAKYSPAVAFFSGSGTNGAPVAYSAYCASKLLLIKMCEILDAESEDTNFFIIGPGIVRTKIHGQTLAEPIKSLGNYERVKKFLISEEAGTSFDEIYQCLSWCYKSGKEAVGGRNISLVFDDWRDGGLQLIKKLNADNDLYKMRRFGNNLKIK